MEMVLDVYNAIPQGFDGEPWMWWTGKFLTYAGTALIWTVVGMNLERRRIRKALQ
jgi:hypothetical protein